MQISRWMFCMRALDTRVTCTLRQEGACLRRAASAATLGRSFSMQTRLHNAGQRRHRPAPTAQPPPPADPKVSVHMRVHEWGRIRPVLAAEGRTADGGAALVTSAFFFGWGGENNASLRALIKGGEGDLSGRTAGRQRASHPPLSLRVHTHTPQSTGTGLGLNIYQAHANEAQKKKK